MDRKDAFELEFTRQAPISVYYVWLQGYLYACKRILSLNMEKPSKTFAVYRDGFVKVYTQKDNIELIKKSIWGLEENTLSRLIQEYLEQYNMLLKKHELVAGREFMQELMGKFVVVFTLGDMRGHKLQEKALEARKTTEILFTKTQEALREFYGREGFYATLSFGEIISRKKIPKDELEIREQSILTLHEIMPAKELDRYLEENKIAARFEESGSKQRYEKVFTRDFSLPMLELWYKGEALASRPWSGKKQEISPYIVFERAGGTVKAYYDRRGIVWIKAHVIETAKKDKNFLKELEKKIREKIKPLQEIYETEKALSREDFIKFIESYEEAYPWIEAMWWLCEMSKPELQGLDISALRELRETTAKISAGTDVVARKSLSKIFPHLKNQAHVLTIEEIKSGKFPSKEELEKRSKGFFFTESRLFVDAKKEEIEEKYNILLEEEIVPETSRILGKSASLGAAKGKVRKVMGHEHIGLLKEGEILVSPMTMPDFAPAMKKAAAFVTDEGGITCHAAIVAREMKKPCIVGTKNATQILKDGDFVEVDADKGTVKIIKRAE